MTHAILFFAFSAIITPAHGLFLRTDSNNSPNGICKSSPQMESNPNSLRYAFRNSTLLIQKQLCVALAAAASQAVNAGTMNGNKWRSHLI